MPERAVVQHAPTNAILDATKYKDIVPSSRTTPESLFVPSAPSSHAQSLGKPLPGVGSEAASGLGAPRRRKTRGPRAETGRTPPTRTNLLRLRQI